jgi:hypothetical protein
MKRWKATMTHSEFNHLLSSVATLSPEQMRQLQRELETRMAAIEQKTAPAPLTEAEAEDQEAQRRLFAAGLVSEIKPPIRDLSPYRDRTPVPILGEPLSETVIRERR